jgi:hypothetical protein
MSYAVQITDNLTDESRTVPMDGEWEGLGGGEFWWNEGNGACDCNRDLAFHGWPPSYEGEDDDGMPCGHTRYTVILAS